MTCHLNWRTQSALAGQVIIPTKCTHIAAGSGGTNVTLATKCAHVAAEGDAEVVVDVLVVVCVIGGG